MLQKNFNLLFYLKRPKKPSKGPVPVYLRITVNGVRKEIATGRSCEPDRWNPNAGRASGNKEEIRSLNAFLDTLQLNVHEARRKAVEEGKVITSALLKGMLTGEYEKPKMLLEVFKYHNEQALALVNKEFAPATIKQFKTSLEHMKAFIQMKHNASDIDIKRLDFEFVTEYSFWLKSVKECGHNSTLKYISQFRKIVNICIRNGWLSKDPFLGFSMSRVEVEKTALTPTELEAISKKIFCTDRLNQVKDIFLFSCYTGLAYADIQKLKRTEIATGIDGEQWIFTSRQKTDTGSRIPLLPMTLDILAKYKEHPQCINQDRVLPVPSNQKMNAYLKEIADLCGITKKLTFHIARHTFATTVTMCNGVPIESISKMLGHKNLKTTQHYAKILDMKVSADMTVLKQKLQSVS